MSVSSVKVQPGYVREVTKSCLVSAAIGDRVGCVLNQYLPHERFFIFDKGWYKTRGKIPEALWEIDRTGFLVSNSTLMLEIWDLLEAHRPDVHGLSDEFVQDYAAVTQSHLVDRSYSGVILGSAVGFGLWSSLRYLKRSPSFATVSSWFDILECMYDFIAITARLPTRSNKDAMIAMAYMLKGLPSVGYFSPNKHIADMVDNGIINRCFSGVLLSMLEDIQSNPNALYEPVYLQKYGDLTYIDRIVVEAFFLMSKVADARFEFRRSKHVLCDMGKLNDVGMQDILFLFGAFFSASEHFQPIFPKPIRKNIEESLAISSLFE